jgi:hypothetical protein
VWPLSPQRIGLRPRETHGRQRSSASNEMQELTAMEKFHCAEKFHGRQRKMLSIPPLISFALDVVRLDDGSPTSQSGPMHHR